MSFWTAQNKLYAIQTLRHGAGLSALGAAGLVTRWAYIEAAGGPTAINPSSGAFGIAQWLGNRKAKIYPNTDFQTQLNFAISELNGAESRAGNVLRAAQTVGEAARGASMYERAEGYNQATGRDNWTDATARSIPAVYALLSTSIPTNVAQIPPSLPDGNDAGSDYTDSAIAMPGNANTKLTLGLAIGAVLLWLYWR